MTRHREYPLTYTDAIAAGLDPYVDPDVEAELDNLAEAGMDLRAECR